MVYQYMIFIGTYLEKVQPGPSLYTFLEDLVTCAVSLYGLQQ